MRFSSHLVRNQFCYDYAVTDSVSLPASYPDPDREIYPNAPLKLVTFELRFAPVDLPTSATDAFVVAVRDQYPVAGPALPQLVIGPTGPAATSTGVRVFDVARQHAVTFASQRIAFETSAYRRFEELRDSITDLFRVVEGLGLELVPTRAGLRYIDEIDQEQLPEPRAWSRYIEPALSSPLEHFDPPPREHQSAALFERPDGHNIVLRYGLMHQPAVDPTGPLVIQEPPRGAYYLIDIDSAWQGQERDVQITRWLVDKLGELHAPVRHLFETSITDELRNQVLRRGTP